MGTTWSEGDVVAIAHQQLCAAIESLHVIEFTYGGCRRIAEPHDYGTHAGRPKLFFYQLGGESSSGAPLGWRLAHVPEMSSIRITDRKFPGSRPTPSGRHIRWDSLFASVSRRGSPGWRRHRPKP
jgi:hypothetical protein